jgi:ZIP family zinc transporter
MQFFSDLPWLQAGAWGAIVSLGMIGGAYFGTHGPFDHAGIARIMAAGAGLLLAAASLELVASAAQSSGVVITGAGLLAGAAVFSTANAWLSNRDARHRKRCGGCVEQPTESRSPGSGSAIALGTLFDAVPEAVVLGIQTHQTGFSGWTILAAIALGNFAEATSSASGMQVAKRSNGYIFGVWAWVSLAVVAVASISAALAGMLAPETDSICKAFAAGALIAMIVETMIPEAADESVPFNGVMAAIGFLVIVLLLGR